MHRGIQRSAVLSQSGETEEVVRLLPSLADMRVPVMAYIIVITAMVIGAFTVLGDTALHSTGRFMVLFGAVSFYISDLFVARDRFLKTEFANRLVGLPLYYAGQFLLAFSIGLIG